MLSAYSPVQSLKGAGVQKGSEKWYLRKGLIVFQFSISLIFIIASLVIGNQIRYMHDSDKGFRTDAIITVRGDRGDRAPGDRIKVLKSRIERIPGVDDVVLEAFAPMGFPHMFQSIAYKGKEDMTLNVSLQPGNEGLIPFYDMKLLAGRNVFPSDSLKEIIINETCMKRLGFSAPGEALGKVLGWGDGRSYPIVGVVADFHENSFHEPMKPVVIAHMPEQEMSMGIRLVTKGRRSADVKPILAAIESQWKKILPDVPFDYSFLDESITWLYDQETKTAWLMNVAMIITIFISCMGLFGLALFTAEQRRKEIGIRKVLGATVANITSMLSRDFLVLVIIALVIASPVAWYFMNQWLQDFVYRIHISGWIFVLAGSGAMLIAAATVSFQAIRAAIANPVKSLRSE